MHVRLNSLLWPCSDRDLFVLYMDVYKPSLLDISFHSLTNVEPVAHPLTTVFEHLSLQCVSMATSLDGFQCIPHELIVDPGGMVSSSLLKMTLVSRCSIQPPGLSCV